MKRASEYVSPFGMKHSGMAGVQVDISTSTLKGFKL